MSHNHIFFNFLKFQPPKNYGYELSSEEANNAKFPKINLDGE
jgi:hypothetical protein